METAGNRHPITENGTAVTKNRYSQSDYESGKNNGFRAVYSHIDYEKTMSVCPGNKAGNHSKKNNLSNQKKAMIMAFLLSLCPGHNKGCFQNTI